MIALYLRVSHTDARPTGEADEPSASASIEGQRLLLERHVERMRAEGLLHEGECDRMEAFVDEGFSGMSRERPGLERLIAACAAGGIDCVMVNDLSRLSRSYIDLGDIVERDLLRAGVRFVSRAEGIDLAGMRAPARPAPLASVPPSAGDSWAELDADLLRGVVSICNNAYSLQVSRSMRSFMEASWKRGEHVQAYAPFGYVYDKAARGRLRIDPVAGEWVADMFDLAASGMDPGEVARELRWRGVPTPAGYAKATGGVKANCYGDRVTPWNARKARYILGREVYVGTLVGGATRGMGVGRGSPRRATFPGEQVRVEGAHEPLVTRAVFEAAQATLARTCRTRR